MLGKNCENYRKKLKKNAIFFVIKNFLRVTLVSKRHFFPYSCFLKVRFLGIYKEVSEKK